MPATMTRTSNATSTARAMRVFIVRLLRYGSYRLARRVGGSAQELGLVDFHVLVAELIGQEDLLLDGCLRADVVALEDGDEEAVQGDRPTRHHRPPEDFPGPDRRQYGHQEHRHLDAPCSESAHRVLLLSTELRVGLAQPSSFRRRPLGGPLTPPPR